MNKSASASLAIAHLEAAQYHYNQILLMSIEESTLLVVEEAKKLNRGLIDGLREEAGLPAGKVNIFLPIFPKATQRHLVSKTSRRVVAR